MGKNAKNVIKTLKNKIRVQIIQDMFSRGNFFSKENR